jgi:hypothetical protein
MWHVDPFLGNGPINTHSWQQKTVLSMWFANIHCWATDVFSVRSDPSLYNERPTIIGSCGGWVEYLHRDPASRRRRRKGKSQIWDSKIWSRVPRDSYPRKTALASASSIYKRQTCPLVREGAPQNKTVIVKQLGLITKTYWLTDCQSQCDFDFDLNWQLSRALQGRLRRDGAIVELNWGFRCEVLSSGQRKLKNLHC